MRRPDRAGGHRWPVTALVLLLGGGLVGCQSSAPPARVSPSPAPSASGQHRVVYRFGTVGRIAPGALQKIVITWRDPSTGRLRGDDQGMPREAVEVGYTVSGAVDRARLYANAQSDAPGVTASCAVLVDNRIVAFDPGRPAIMAVTGTAEQSGIANCSPAP